MILSRECFARYISKSELMYPESCADICFAGMKAEFQATRRESIAHKDPHVYDRPSYKGSVPEETPFFTIPGLCHVVDSLRERIIKYETGRMASVGYETMLVTWRIKYGELIITCTECLSILIKTK